MSRATSVRGTAEGRLLIDRCRTRTAVANAVAGDEIDEPIDGVQSPQR